MPGREGSVPAERDGEVGCAWRIAYVSTAAALLFLGGGERSVIAPRTDCNKVGIETANVGRPTRRSVVSNHQAAANILLAQDSLV